MRIPVILAAALLSISSPVMASDWSREVSYSGNGDPGVIWFSDDTRVRVEYKEIAWETVEAWPQGKALRLDWSPDAGIELVDVASNQRMSAMLETGAAYPIDLLAEQCMEEPPYDDAECLDAWMRRISAGNGRSRVPTTYCSSAWTRNPTASGCAVRAAQRSWASYRDTQIAAIGQVIGGTDGTIWKDVSKRERNQLLREQQRRLERMTNLWLRP
jgi:hypothetical protein